MPGQKKLSPNMKNFATNNRRVTGFGPVMRQVGHKPDYRIMAGNLLPEGERIMVKCKGGHMAEKVNAKGWCNLCLKDLKSGKPAGTTAKERGLK
jgi:hypothetical protein